MHSHAQGSNRWLHTEAAADLLGVSKAMLEKLRLSGGGPKYAKLGRAVRYPEDGLHAWAQERIRASTSEAA